MADFKDGATMAEGAWLCRTADFKDGATMVAGGRDALYDSSWDSSATMVAGGRDALYASSWDSSFNTKTLYTSGSWSCGVLSKAAAAQKPKAVGARSALIFSWLLGSQSEIWESYYLNFHLSSWGCSPFNKHYFWKSDEVHHNGRLRGWWLHERRDISGRGALRL